MKTSELLMLVLAFVVGYIMFNNCSCRSVEGNMNETQTTLLSCNIPSRVKDYMNLPQDLGQYSITDLQCHYLRGVANSSGSSICTVIREVAGLDNLYNNETCCYEIKQEEPDNQEAIDAICNT